MMRVFARLTWIAAFVFATYTWMVVFEHGLSWKSFSEGFRTEWRNVGALLVGKTGSRS